MKVSNDSEVLKQRIENHLDVMRKKKDELLNLSRNLK